MKLPILFQGKRVGEIDSENDAAVSVLETWNRIGRDMSDQQEEWVKMLRGKGFKAAHPNDGWHDREKRKIFLAYPQFDDGVRVGDKIALGYPWEASYTTINVVSVTHGMIDPITTYYHYKVA